MSEARRATDATSRALQVAAELPYQKAMLDRESRLGNYEVLAPLGSGARSPVYAARLADAVKLDESQLFAIKQLEEARDPKAVRDQITETLRASALLDDARVIPVRELFEEHEMMYVVSKMVNGDSLRHLLDAGARPQRMAGAAIARDIAGVVAVIHRAGLSHGDVSPSTIMISPEGSPMIRELGIAKARSGIGTKHADVRGHTQYMSPERAGGRIMIDMSSDVYSIGLILWELLTGSKAIRGMTEAEQRAAALKADIPPPSSLAKCGRELDMIVGRALSPRREDRYPNAEALEKELARYIISRAPSTNACAELQRLMARHLGNKLRAQKLLIERWVSLAKSRKPRPTTTPPSVRTRNTSAADVGARLFAEIDEVVQDLAAPDSGSVPIRIPDLVIESPATEDLLASTTGNLAENARASTRRSRRDTAFLVLLATALAIAFSIYWFGDEGSTLRDFWSRAISTVEANLGL